MPRSNKLLAIELSGRIRFLCEERGMNAKELANAAGLNYVQLLGYVSEDKPTLPSDDAIKKIAAALEVDPSDLTRGGGEGYRLDLFGEVAAALKTTPIEVAKSLGIDEKTLRTIVQGERPLLASERRRIDSLWRSHFPGGVGDMSIKVGRVPLVTSANLNQVFEPAFVGVKSSEPDADNMPDYGLTPELIRATAAATGGDPATAVPPELSRLKLVLMEFSAWANRTVLKDRSAVDDIEVGVRKLINDVEEQSQPRAAPKDAKRA